MKESPASKLFSVFIGVAALLVALLNWLAPFNPVGLSPFSDVVPPTSVEAALPTESETINTPLSPTKLPAATIDSTPTPKPTLIPVQRWDNETEFSIAQGWDILADADGEVGFKDGELFITNKKGNVFYISLWKALGGDIDSAVFSVDLIGSGKLEAPEAAGLVFGWQPNSQGNTYAFLVDKRGACKFLEESNNSWIMISQGETSNFLSQKESHIVSVVLMDGYAYGYVDGAHCDDHLMPLYEPGYVGVGALSGHSQRDGSKSYFDSARFANLPIINY